jgi:type IV pilus assembly protein PilC
MRFIYTAQDRYGQTLKGEIEAADRKTAFNLISSRGLTPLTLIQIESAAERKTKMLALVFGGRLSAMDVLFITRHLGALLGSGMDLLSALSIIAEEAPNSLTRLIISDIRAQVVSGKSLSDAFLRWKMHFDPVLLNLVKAGEMSGDLAEIMRDYAAELRKTTAFLRKVRGAIFYPAILISALALMMLLMLWVVVPRLQELFRSIGAKPPWYTSALFFLSNVLRHNTALVIFGFIVLVLIVFLARRNRSIRHSLALLLRHLPYLSRIQNYFILRTFSKTLSRLLKAGVDLRRAILITAEAVGPAYGAILEDIAKRQLERGISLSESLQAHRRLFPVLLVSSIAAGEKSGNITSSLDQLAEFYEEETLYALEHFVTIIEPTLIVIVGLIVGLMVGSLISPIYRFIGRF